MQRSAQQMSQNLLQAAVALHRAGDLAKAQRIYKSVLRQAPNNANALNLLGLTFIQEARPRKAADLFRKAVKAAPGIGEIRANLAKALLAAKAPAPAVLRAAEAALRLEPENLTAREVKGVALSQLGRIGEASQVFLALANEVPGHADYARNYGAALLLEQRYSDALKHAEEAIGRHPDHLEIVLLFAQCCVLNDRPERGEEYLLGVLAQGVQDGRVLHEYARTLLHMSRWDTALPFAKAAVDDRPSDESRQLTLAAIRLQLGEIQAAHDTLQHLDRQTKGGWPEARHNLAAAKFALGDVGKAWDLYKARFGAAGSLARRRIYAAPEWDGTDVGRLLVWADQGLGDTLQCAAMLPELFDRARRIILEVEDRFVPFFQSALPVVQCRAFHSENPAAMAGHPADHDSVFCLSDVPGLLRPTLDSFERQRRDVYRIDRELALAYRSTIADSEEKPLVGISWRSRVLGTDRSRFFLTAEQISTLVESTDAVFVNLQYTATEEELAVLSRVGNFRQLADLDLLNDLTGAAALTAACDLVVSPNSSVADMSGMLGVPTLRFGGPTPKLTLGQVKPPWFPEVQFLQMDVSDPAGNIMPRLKAALAAALERGLPLRRMQRLGF